MIEQCTATDFTVIYEIINDGAQAYRGNIPEDRWHDPYMTEAELQEQLNEGVQFWKHIEDGMITGIMGIQYKSDVTLIRHAYVRTIQRGKGIGSKLLLHLCSLTPTPVLIGTWANAVWAISFYTKHGFRQVSTDEKNRLLVKYWSIPERQVETSVVLASRDWHEAKL
jgi:GNAT superfamily N-acetyltransferase